ncbi:MAG: hypothetical protein ACK45E_03355 [Ignavibacteria bacterium]|jgi:hypothetical protein
MMLSDDSKVTEPHTVANKCIDDGEHKLLSSMIRQPGRNYPNLLILPTGHGLTTASFTDTIRRQPLGLGLDTRMTGTANMENGA